jgi:drug/metabolite transporter (DMT)-like permease
MPADSQRSASALQVEFGPGELWASASSLSYAAAAIFSRVASLTVHPLVAPVVRLIPIAVVSWGEVFRSGLDLARLRPSAKDFFGWRLVFVMILGGTLTTVVGTVGYFYALRIGGVVLTQPVLATNILWSALLAAVFLREPLTRKMLVGLLIAVSGVALLGYGRAISGGAASGTLVAIPLALIPAVAWAGASNCTRYALIKGVDKFTILAVGYVWAIAVLLLYVILSGQGQLITSLTLSGVGTLIVAGLLTGAAQITLAQALSLTTVASAATINGMNPVLAAIFAALLLKEELTALMIAGTVLTVLGVIFVQLTKERISTAEVETEADGPLQEKSEGIHNG